MIFFMEKKLKKIMLKNGLIGLISMPTLCCSSFLLSFKVQKLAFDSANFDIFDIIDFYLALLLRIDHTRCNFNFLVIN